MYEKIKPYLGFIFGVIIMALLFSTCSKKPIYKEIKNTIEAELIAKKDNEIEKLIAKSKRDSLRSDSSVKTVTVIKHRYHTVFDTVFKYAPLECDISLNAVNVACLRLDSANKALVLHKDIELIDCKQTVKKYAERKDLTNLQHSNDSTNIVNLHLEVKKQKRTKIAIIFGAIGAVIATVFILK